MSSPLPVNSLFIDASPSPSSFDRRMASLPRLAEELYKIEAETSPTAILWLKMTLEMVLCHDKDIQVATQRFRFTKVSGGLAMGAHPSNAPDELDLAFEMAFWGDALHVIAELADRQIIAFPTRYGGGLTVRMLPKN